MSHSRRFLKKAVRRVPHRFSGGVPNRGSRIRAPIGRAMGSHGSLDRVPFGLSLRVEDGTT